MAKDKDIKDNLNVDGPNRKAKLPLDELAPEQQEAVDKQPVNDGDEEKLQKEAPKARPKKIKMLEPFHLTTPFGSLVILRDTITDDEYHINMVHTHGGKYEEVD